MSTRTTSNSGTAAPPTTASSLRLDVASLARSFRDAAPAKQALAVLAAAGVLVGAGFIVRRMTARRARQRANLPDAAQCSYTQLRVDESQSYGDYLSAAKTARAAAQPGQPWYVYVGAANNPQTGTPWCGDCRVANPLVHAAFERAHETQSDIVMVATFADRATYKDALNPHPLRTDPELRISAIPTLCKFVHGACVGRLVEAECADTAKLEAFLARD